MTNAYKCCIAGLTISLCLMGGCRRGGSVIIDDPVDPNEQVVPFNVTVEQMAADLPTHWLTLANNRRWTFAKDDKITLTLISGPSQVDQRTTATIVKVNAVNPARPTDVLDGVIRIQYEMIDGRWYLTQVTPNGVNQYKRR